MKLKTSFLLALTAFYLPRMAQAQTCTATLCGVVTEAGTGNPIAFAEVSIAELNTGVVTDEQGKFHFHDLCDSTYTIVCQHIGCAHVVRQVRVSGNVVADFELQHEALGLQEVVVRERAMEPLSTQAKSRLDGLELTSVKGQTLGDALRKLPGVTTLQTGGSIVKPVIRGLHSNRILILNNGVRQEGQQWGVDHAPEIDPYLAGEVAVEYGANSVRYGADAMGGVILVLPKPVRETAGTGGELHLAGFSNGRTGALSASLESRLRGKLPLGARLQGTLRRGGNLHTPGYFLENTALREMNYSATLDLSRRQWHSEVFFSQFFTDLGIFKGAHIGNLTDLQQAIERGRPTGDGSFSYSLGRPLQRVAHYLLKTSASRQLGQKGRLSLQYARQFNRRQEFDAHKRFSSVPAETELPEMMFEVTTHTFDAAWEHRQWRHLSGSMGFQAMAQRNTTDRGGLIPDYNSQTAGFFWVERWRNYPFPLELEAGLRFDLRQIQALRRGNEVLDSTLNFRNLSASAGAIYRFSDQWRLRLNAGSAWRAPGVNELYSEGVHHGSASYERGRSDLKPERAYNLSLTLEYDNGRTLSGTLAVYRNFVRDFIYLQPLSRPVLTIRGAFPAFAYEQADARLLGFDWTGAWKPFPWLEFQSGASVLRARNLREDDWLVLMPADRIRQGVQYNLPLGQQAGAADRPFVRLTFDYVFRQQRVPAGQDYAPPPAAYALFSLQSGASAELHGYPLHFGLNINNLFNTAYRDYLNRLRYFGEEMGRNVSVWLRFTY
ncbi:MAG: hypothetical protein RI973_1463 [Bacteroidota bacterium]|jgi:iron complex outermembrane receptor protein